MVTSGLRMQPISKHTNASVRPQSAIGGKLARVAVCCLAGLLVLGCATSIRMGKAPATDRLQELTWNVSTEKDVVAVLGEPQGRGATRNPTYGLKDVWLYMNLESDGMRARSRMLMVFIEEDKHVYQGYMWVASGMLFGQTK